MNPSRAGWSGKEPDANFSLPVSVLLERESQVRGASDTKCVVCLCVSMCVPLCVLSSHSLSLSHTYNVNVCMYVCAHARARARCACVRMFNMHRRTYFQGTFKGVLDRRGAKMCV